MLSIILAATLAVAPGLSITGLRQEAGFVEFYLSGVDLPGRQIRKGAASAVMKWVRDNGGHPTDDVGHIVDGISSSGGTPLVVAECVAGQPARAQ